MTPAQKLALRASEIRSRLAELGGTEDLTDELRAEIGTLRTEYTDVETRSQALIVAEDEVKPTETETRSEDKELATLIAGASVASIFGATLEHRSTVGQTRELQAELGLGDNQVPLALLETRAVTPAPADVGQNHERDRPGRLPG